MATNRTNIVTNNRYFVIDDLMIQNVEDYNNIYFIENAKTPIQGAKKIATKLQNVYNGTSGHNTFIFSIRETTANSRHAKNYYYYSYDKLIRIKNHNIERFIA